MRSRIYLAAGILAGVMTLGCPVVAKAETSAALEAVMVTALEKAIEVEAQTADSGSQGMAVAAEAPEAAEPEAGAEVSAEAQAAAANVSRRQNLVNYALQFVGGPYKDGGNDPHTGVDCSGFVRYVMQNGAGVSMNRSSRDQALQGQSISADAMQPGDLLFYADGSRINHVAMYIGDGQVVHASTYKTGIKISKWNYRDPVRIVSMLG